MVSRRRSQGHVAVRGSGVPAFGTRVEVFWDGDQCYYRGTAQETDDNGCTSVAYDDGELHIHRFAEERWLFCNEADARRASRLRRTEDSRRDKRTPEREQTSPRGEGSNRLLSGPSERTGAGMGKIETDIPESAFPAPPSGVVSSSKAAPLGSPKLAGDPNGIPASLLGASYDTVEAAAIAQSSGWPISGRSSSTPASVPQRNPAAPGPFTHHTAIRSSRAPTVPSPFDPDHPAEVVGVSKPLTSISNRADPAQRNNSMNIGAPAWAGPNAISYIPPYGVPATRGSAVAPAVHRGNTATESRPLVPGPGTPSVPSESDIKGRPAKSTTPAQVDELPAAGPQAAPVETGAIAGSKAPISASQDSSKAHSGVGGASDCDDPVDTFERAAIQQVTEADGAAASPKLPPSPGQDHGIGSRTQASNDVAPLSAGGSGEAVGSEGGTDPEPEPKDSTGAPEDSNNAQLGEAALGGQTDGSGSTSAHLRGSGTLSGVADSLKRRPVEPDPSVSPPVRSRQPTLTPDQGGFMKPSSYPVSAQCPSSKLTRRRPRSQSPSSFDESDHEDARRVRPRVSSDSVEGNAEGAPRQALSTSSMRVRDHETYDSSSMEIKALRAELAETKERIARMEQTMQPLIPYASVIAALDRAVAKVLAPDGSAQSSASGLGALFHGFAGELGFVAGSAPTTVEHDGVAATAGVENAPGPEPMRKRRKM